MNRKYVIAFVEKQWWEIKGYVNKKKIVKRWCKVITHIGIIVVINNYCYHSNFINVMFSDPLYYLSAYSLSHSLEI